MQVGNSIGYNEENNFFLEGNMPVAFWNYLAGVSGSIPGPAQNSLLSYNTTLSMTNYWTKVQTSIDFIVIISSRIIIIFYINAIKSGNIRVVSFGSHPFGTSLLVI